MQQGQMDRYKSEYLTWLDLVQKCPVLKSALGARADAVTASFEVKGRNAGRMRKLLSKMRGKGKDTFRQIIKNMLMISYVGGDAYAEIVTDEDGFPTNLVILPPDNITQIVENGIIIKYEENNAGKAGGTTKTFPPQKIFHLRCNPVGSVTHGYSLVEGMKALVLGWLQIMDDQLKIFHLYAEPKEVIKVDSDEDKDLSKAEDLYKKSRQVRGAALVIPSNAMAYERWGVPAGSTLDPRVFEERIVQHIMMGNRTSEIMLGQGSANSEESARLTFTGFRQVVRADEADLSDALEVQVFGIAYPENTPKIEWSFASEGQEEHFQRWMGFISTANQLQVNSRIKTLLIEKGLQEAGVMQR